MRSLLLKFSATIGWGSLTAVLVVLLVLAFAYIKSPKGTVFFLKIAGCILAFVVLPVSAVFSGVKINSYYSAEGGIFGRIRQSLNLNSGKVSTDTFEIEELNLRLDENKEYTATITVNVAEADTVLKLSANKKYCLEVNGALTYNNFTSSTGPTLSISADYTYTFRDFENAEIVKDTLHFAFQINARTITCRVSSKGTAQTQKLWSRYCDKNGLKIHFVEETYKKPSVPSVNDGDVSNLVLVQFLDEDKESVLASKIIDKDSKIDFIPEIKTLLFLGWYDGENTSILTNEQVENYELTKDVSFQLMIADEKHVKIDMSEPLSIQWESKDEALAVMSRTGIWQGEAGIVSRDIKVNFNFKYNEDLGISKFRFDVLELTVIDKNGKIYYVGGDRNLSESPISQTNIQISSEQNSKITFSDSSFWEPYFVTGFAGLNSYSYNDWFYLYMRSVIGALNAPERYLVYSVKVTNIEVWFVPDHG